MPDRHDKQFLEQFRALERELENEAFSKGELFSKEGIRDPLLIPGRLNEIAKEYIAAGNTVARGPFGIVILKLEDGEVWYIPAADGIECRLRPNLLLKTNGEKER